MRGVQFISEYPRCILEHLKNNQNYPGLRSSDLNSLRNSLFLPEDTGVNPVDLCSKRLLANFGWQSSIASAAKNFPD